MWGRQSWRQAGFVPALLALTHKQERSNFS
jgi:hypothetical protein